MLLRIGEKVIDRQRILHVMDRILELRGQGFSQQETANAVGIDRTFVSRLETIGEVRKGSRLALIGFPVLNGSELARMASQEGVDHCLLLSEQERWRFVQEKNGAELCNTLMDMAAALRQYDIVILIASTKRIRLMQALLTNEVVSIPLGESPLAEDKYVDPEEIRGVIRQLRLVEEL